MKRDVFFAAGGARHPRLGATSLFVPGPQRAALGAGAGLGPLLHHHLAAQLGTDGVELQAAFAFGRHRGLACGRVGAPGAFSCTKIHSPLFGPKLLSPVLEAPLWQYGCHFILCIPRSRDPKSIPTHTTGAAGPPSYRRGQCRDSSKGRWGGEDLCFHSVRSVCLRMLVLQSCDSPGG